MGVEPAGRRHQVDGGTAQTVGLPPRHRPTVGRGTPPAEPDEAHHLRLQPGGQPRHPGQARPVLGRAEGGGPGGGPLDQVGHADPEAVEGVGRVTVPGDQPGGQDRGPEAVAGAGEAQAGIGGVHAGVQPAHQQAHVGPDPVGQGAQPGGAHRHLPWSRRRAPAGAEAGTDHDVGEPVTAAGPGVGVGQGLGGEHQAHPGAHLQAAVRVGQRLGQGPRRHRGDIDGDGPRTATGISWRRSHRRPRRRPRRRRTHHRPRRCSTAG